MTKLDLVLARIRKLPPERQEAVAVEIDLLLDIEAKGSVFTNEQWAKIETSMEEGGELIPHEDIVAEIRTKFPG